MNNHRFFTAATLLALVAATLSAIVVLGLRAEAQTSASVGQRSSQLNKLLDQEWQWRMRDRPELATAFGDYRYNNRWSEVSVAHEAKRAEVEKRFLARFESIDTTGLSERDRLNQELMAQWLKQQIEGYRLKAFEMPVNQFMGL